MKRDRVYLSKPDRLPFAPDQASALTRLMAVLESSFDGIFITDGQATPLWCNHSYEIISGLTAADVLGIPMAQLVATGVISHSSTLKALNQGQAVTLEQTFTTGKQAVVTSTPIYDQDDNVCLVVTNVRDISELTALQETLDHQRRLSAKYRQEMSVIRAQLMTTPQLVAEDPATLNLLRIVSRAAQLDTVVLIQGETGTGKERIATYIHQRSPRASKNFIRVNCGAIPENLAESELFGYERGAFTGANREGKPGLFEVANEGTIFLDEVGELSLATQTKLLRVLQDGTFERVGGVETLRSNARVVAATNKRPEREIASGHFRADLFYRLNGPRAIELPALRERPEDIPPLAEFILGRLREREGEDWPDAALSPEALAALLAYSWPGNVRELEHALLHALALVDDGPILPEHLPREMAPPGPIDRAAADLFATDLTLGEITDALLGPVEREYFTRLLTLYEGNVAQCARHCRMSRRIISARLRELGLDYRTFRRPASPASTVI